MLTQKIKPKVFLYNQNKGEIEYLLQKRFKFYKDSPDSNTDSRKLELELSTNDNFTVVSSPFARSKDSIIKCNKCNQNFHKIFGSIFNRKYLTCPNCGFSYNICEDYFYTFVAFLLDKEYAIQYYGFLLALSEYEENETYYVIKDTGILLKPILIGEVTPNYDYNKILYDYRKTAVFRWSRPSWLDKEYIYNIIPEDVTNLITDSAENWKNILIDAFNNGLFVTEDIYEQIKDHIPNITRTIDPVLLGKITRNLQPETVVIQTAKKSVSSELKFKKYYFHNIPINDLKLLSGIKDVSGIYIIRDENNNYYVGQGVHCIKRCLQHFTNKPIDTINAAYLSGISFILEDIITGIEGQDYIHLDTLERICIEHYNAYKSGYNKTQGNKSNDIVTLN